MLTRFTVGNFRSFDKNQTLSLIANTGTRHNERLYKTKDMNLLKFGAIFGANAAGKSNFIKAISFAQRVTIFGTEFIKDELYFKLNPLNKEQPSYFEFELCIDEKIYAYGFEVIISKKQITEEWLVELGKTHDTDIFSRNTVTGTLSFNKSMLTEKYEERMKVYVDDFLRVQNKSFLEYIISNKEELFKQNPQLEILKKIFNWILELNISYPNTTITGYDCFSVSNFKTLLSVIKYFNTDITGIRENVITKEAALEKTLSDFKKHIEDRLQKVCNADCEKAPDSCKNCGFRMNINGRLIFVTFENREPKFTEVTFIHNNYENVEFSLSEESEGTQRLLDLLSVLLTQRENSVFIIDEIDRSLHPQLTVKFVQVFLDIAKSKNIQLFISTHESHLLNLDILRQDEIFMVDKKTNGASIVSPFDRFKERFDAKIEARYLDGRYDGVPIFDRVFPFDVLQQSEK